jgi:hypothetical protein
MKRRIHRHRRGGVGGRRYAHCPRCGIGKVVKIRPCTCKEGFKKPVIHTTLGQCIKALKHRIAVDESWTAQRIKRNMSRSRRMFMREAVERKKTKGPK